MTAPLVYLCGPIGGLTYDQGNDWRQHAAHTLAIHGIGVLSPLRHKDYLRARGKLHCQGYDENPLSVAAGIVSRDRFDVQRCDLLLANFLRAGSVSIGSCVELGWADAWRKPIVLAMEPQGLHEHCFVQTLAGFRTETLDAALEIAVRVLSTGTGA